MAAVTATWRSTWLKADVAPGPTARSALCAVGRPGTADVGREGRPRPLLLSFERAELVEATTASAAGPHAPAAPSALSSAAASSPSPCLRFAVVSLLLTKRGRGSTCVSVRETPPAAPTSLIVSRNRRLAPPAASDGHRLAAGLLDAPTYSDDTAPPAAAALPPATDASPAASDTTGSSKMLLRRLE
jgi:hypothetical protein